MLHTMHSQDRRRFVRRLQLLDNTINVDSNIPLASYLLYWQANVLLSKTEDKRVLAIIQMVDDERTPVGQKKRLQS